MHSGANLGANLILDTPDGSFTLNLPDRELKDGSGRVIQLTEAQAGELATLYNEISFADDLGNALATSPPPIPMCGEVPCAPELRSLDGAGTETGSGSVRGKHVAGYGRFKVRRRPAGSSSLETLKTNVIDHGNVMLAPGGTVNFQGPWACRDIAETIFNVRMQHLASRVSVGRVLSEIFASIEFAVVGGVLVGRAGPAVWVAAQVGGVAAQHMSRSVALSILAWSYSANNCWNNTWPDRSSYSGGFGSGTGGGAVGGFWIKECHNEQWEISYDGGVSWSPIVVSVCEYVYVR